MANTHPFRYGPWVFAHNGTIPGAARSRDTLLADLSPELRANVQGETDRELAFPRILARLVDRRDTVDVPVAEAADSVARIFRAFRREHEDNGERSMDFLLARHDGFVATRLHRDLACRLGEGDMGPYTLVASEPLGVEAGSSWQIPEGHLVIASEPGKIEVGAIL